MAITKAEIVITLDEGGLHLKTNIPMDNKITLLGMLDLAKDSVYKHVVKDKPIVQPVHAMPQVQMIDMSKLKKS